MSESVLLADLRALLGEQAIVTGERLAGRAYDPHVGPVRAKVLVRPADTSQVAAVLRLCHARGQPVVPHGGLTGLVQGAVARENEFTVEEVDLAVHAHPTLSEAIAEAVMDSMGRMVHA